MAGKKKRIKNINERGGFKELEKTQARILNNYNLTDDQIRFIFLRHLFYIKYNFWAYISFLPIVFTSSSYEIVNLLTKNPASALIFSLFGLFAIFKIIVHRFVLHADRFAAENMENGSEIGRQVISIRDCSINEEMSFGIISDNFPEILIPDYKARIQKLEQNKHKFK